MKLTYTGPFISLMMLFISCKKETTTNTIPNPNPNMCITLSGYTGRDVAGDQTGPVDTTDWRLDNTLSACEAALIGTTNYNTNCVFDDTLLSNPVVYPNPTSDIFHFDVGMSVLSTDTDVVHAIVHHDSTITVDLLVLNQQLQPVGIIHSNKHQLKLTSCSLNAMDAVSSDTVFRVYYKLTDSNNCVRAGHGDILRR